jgi:hypothetical protein
MTHKTTIRHAPSGLLPGHPQEYFWWSCSCGATSTPHHPIYRVTDWSEVEAQARRHVAHGPGYADAAKGRAGVREKGWRS